MRAAHLLFARCAANAYVIWDIFKFTFAKPEVISPPLLVYTRWSIEPPKGRKVARQIGVGYWKRADPPALHSSWVDAKIFFREEYNQETRTWNRVIPKPRPSKERTPWYRP